MLSRLLAALIISCCAATAAAQVSPASVRETPQHLTSRHRLMVSGAIGGYWSNDKPLGYGSYSHWALYAYPAVTYFVRDRVGVGVSISAGTSRSETALYMLRDHNLGAAALARFDLPLGKRVSLFFEPRAGYFEQWLDREPTPLGSQLPTGVGFGSAQGALFQDQIIRDLVGPDRRRFLRFALSLPLVFHVTASVGLALGPDLWFDVMLESERYMRTQVGASTSIYVSL